jgi:phosphoribosylaminoimidazole-succinocarboxamide synthase
MPVEPEVLAAAAAPGGTVDALPESFDVLGRRYSGKVRENFTRDGQRVIVVTDRLSAFDVVLGTIPFKGQVLNAMAEYWFRLTRDSMPNHMIDVPDPQAMRAIECEPIPVEVVVRGYLTGTTSTSIWRAYERGQRTFCGHRLPPGLAKHERLPSNIVTPSTKAPKGGHDLSVSKDELYARGLVDPETFERLESQALALFAFGQRMAAQRGLLLVDTKYELGRTPSGEIVLIDEIHTPDSSRYWIADAYDDAMSRREDPKALDKEFVRRWLAQQGFDGHGPPPPLPDAIRIEAARRYVETYERITGQTFVPDTTAPLERLAAHLGVPTAS